MITEVLNSKGTAALTSDRWHVVHARFMFAGAKRPFLRSVHSEWSDRPSCRAAARALRAQLTESSAGVPRDERDQIFVCKPNFKSLKVATGRRGARRR